MAEWLFRFQRIAAVGLALGVVSLASAYAQVAVLTDERIHAGQEKEAGFADCGSTPSHFPTTRSIINEGDLLWEGLQTPPHCPSELNGCGYCEPACCEVAPGRSLYAPPMIGDFFLGRTGGIRGVFSQDRLLVPANDLDAPAVLPPGAATLTITEPGPVGIFETNVVSAQELQQLLRAGAPIPAPTLAGQINEDATLTTASTVAEIQALLAATPGVAFDIIPLAPPPATYAAAVNTAFEARNRPGGETAYDAAGSGAFLQAGDDTLNGGEDFDAFYYYDYAFRINLASPSAGAFGGGRLKFAEGGSPLTQDRVFFHYGLFDNTPLLPGGMTVNRFTPGFEKSLLSGATSIEMRFPFAATLDNTITTGPGGATNADDVQFGNIAVYSKTMLFVSDRVGVSAGLGVTVPTAQDVDVRLAGGPTLVAIENESVHLQPFFGGVYTPTERLFTQTVLQFDFAANGNSVSIFDGANLAPAGTLTDASFLFLDAGAGYWLYRADAYSSSILSGVAGMLELHYNCSLQDTDVVTANNFQVGDFASDIEILNLTVGAAVEFGPATTLSAGYVTPLTSSEDRQFDGGFRVMLNHYPGGRY